jgi:hypothetical protein
MKLPNDTARCVQYRCPVKDSCKRFVDRITSHPSTVYIGPQDFGDSGCELLILTDEGRALKDAQLDAFADEMRRDEEPLV